MRRSEGDGRNAPTPAGERSSLISSQRRRASSAASTSDVVKGGNTGLNTGGKGKAKTMNGGLVLFYCACLLFVSVGNSIFFKKMTNHMPNYPYFLSQITTVVYIPIFGGVVLYQLMFTDTLTTQMRKFPKVKFFLMGAFDSLGGVFMLFGGVHTSGSSQALLTNAVIPVTMGLAYVVLGTRFKRTQYAGAVVIMAGVALVLAPTLMSPAAPGATADVPLFNMIFLASVLPGALSSVYKEIAFSNDDIDVNYLQSWVAIFQLMFGIILMPLNTLSFLGSNTLPWNKLFSSLADGAMCMWGENTIVDNCYTGTPVPGMKLCDACEGALWPIVIYVAFNCAYNVFIMLVIKHGSAALMYIVMTLRLPLVQVAFSIRAINDPPDAFHWPSLVGLAFIISGLVAYRWQTESTTSKDQEDVVVPAVGALPVGLPLPIRRRRLGLGRTRKVIRSDLYSRLGVIPSPVTPHSPRSHRGTPNRGTPTSNYGATGRRTGSQGRTPTQEHRLRRGYSNV